MRAVVVVMVVSLVAGCKLLPPELPPPPEAPPAGDGVLLFGEEVAADPEAIRQAVARRCPPGTSPAQVQARLAADGLPVTGTERRDGRRFFTYSGPMLSTSRWAWSRT